MTRSAESVPDPLLDAARRGDETALRNLVESVYPRVRRWALVQSGDPDDADDLTQDVMIRMIRKLPTFQGHSSFESWLYSMTRNAALDRHRMRSRSKRAALDPRTWEALVPSRVESPARSAEVSEIRDLLAEFFTELPERQRQVFDLVELQGLSAAEAGELMGIEPVSVRANLFKARRRMRRRILEVSPTMTGEDS